VTTAIAKTQAERHQAFADSLAVLTTVPIDSPERATWAVEEARKLRAKLREMVADKESMTKPLHEAWKAALGFFGPPIKAVENVIDALKRNAAAFHRAQIETQQKALAAAAVSSSPTEIAAAVAITTTKPAGLHEMTVWEVEIVNPAEIPAEFWIVDVARLQARAKSEKEAFNVPGCRAIARKVPVLR
jgi:hypothetical protein